MSPETILANCNPSQRDAVLHDHQKDGPLLILAGAGSGKTSVLTRRIQWLVSQKGVDPASILGLTFTAKAAGEMLERVGHSFGGQKTGIRLCTFHSLALALLRDVIEGIPNWKRLGFSHPPMPTEGASRHWEGRVLRAGLPRGALLREDLFSPHTQWGARLEPLQRDVLASGKVLFDDLIWLAIVLLQGHGEIRTLVQRRWRQILLDEYQDINAAQYQLVRAILGDSPNLFVVGDDDQAIYGFRGADIGNILRFRKDYPNCKVLKLEWNYRSTPPILSLANVIFQDKPLMLRKCLRPGSSRHDPLFAEYHRVECWECGHALQELDRIRGECEGLRASFGLGWHDFAILVRYNHQKEWYALGLRNWGVPVEGDADVPSGAGLQIETIHGSKGLQYPVVFYAGLAAGLTPGRVSAKGKAGRAQSEEERRLFYVGVTRAESRLYLLFCRRRHWQGRLQDFCVSPYLAECKLSFHPLQEKRRIPVLLLWKIWVAIQELGYMAWSMLLYVHVRIFKGSEVQAWTERRLDAWARFSLHVLGFNLEVRGQSNAALVDWNRPVFVIGNHNSYADIPTVLVALERMLGFVAKYELGRIPFLGYWMRQIGCLMIKRGKAGVGEEVNAAIRQMPHAPNLVIFPEGTRCKKSEMGAFKSGAFRMAVDHRGIVLPLVIRGSRLGWEGRTLPWKRVQLVCEILPPLDCASLQGESGAITHKELMLLARQRIQDALNNSSHGFQTPAMRG